MKLEFYLHIFKKILKYQISQKSVQWELSCSMLTDRQTDMMKLTDAFHNFVNAPKNEECILKINIKRIWTGQIWLRFGV